MSTDIRRLLRDADDHQKLGHIDVRYAHNKHAPTKTITRLAILR